MRGSMMKQIHPGPQFRKLLSHISYTYTPLCIAHNMSMPPPRSPSVSRHASSANTNVQATSPSVSPTSMTFPTPAKSPVVVLGVCAMDVKARSKAMREILTRLVDIEAGGVEIKIFGDVVILEEGTLTHSLVVVGLSGC
jgi:hypothetical protein